MKIAVVGSRDFANSELLELTLNKYVFDKLVSGGAKGADTLAEQYAKDKKIETEIYLPDYKKYGKKATIIRNKDIVKNADFIIAFWNGVSSGTKMTINECHKQKKQVLTIQYK